MFIGQSPLQERTQQVSGSFVTWRAEHYYKISHYDAMPPFFMSIVSSTDHWLFISSNGALTAGRRNPDIALFPYYTDDKIQDSADITGSLTVLQVTRGERTYAWEPFLDRDAGLYQVTHNLYKTIHGDKLLFEAVNHDLGIAFRYAWMSSDAYGLVRRAWLENLSGEALRVRLLDGVRNILPHGVSQVMQNRVSTLADAYKKNELDPATGLGMYMLSSIIVDRAEPSEALKCHTVWSAGLAGEARLVSTRQLAAFRQGRAVATETDIRAERGAYLLSAQVELGAGEERSWYLVAEVNQGPAEVAEIRRQLGQPEALVAKLEADIARGSAHLAA
ncbi:MAG: hypothetical protein KDC54_07195, partial [Lewinella sp.]|nr:hypothetical protein [Lewinella sp.]